MPKLTAPTADEEVENGTACDAPLVETPVWPEDELVDVAVEFVDELEVVETPL